MNFLKGMFGKNDRMSEDYDEPPYDPAVDDDDPIFNWPDSDYKNAGATEGDPTAATAREVGFTAPTVTPAEKVALKVWQPKSHTEAARIADQLKDGNIVLLDISGLGKDKAHRLVDFLSGVAYVLGGQMLKTNKTTIVVAPAGVDVSSFVSEPEPTPAAPVEYESYEEISVNE